MQFCINYTRTMSGSQFLRIHELIIVVFQTRLLHHRKAL